MRKTRVKEILTQYRKNMDYIQLYEETSSVGASVVGGNSGDGMITGSQPEGDCMRRQDKREEYEKRKQFNELVELVLLKLPEEQRMVIEHTYNFVDNHEYGKYEIGGIPEQDIIYNLPFERKKYYNKLNQAYKNLQDKLPAVM